MKKVELPVQMLSPWEQWKKETFLALKAPFSPMLTSGVLWRAALGPLPVTRAAVGGGEEGSEEDWDWD